MHRNNLTQTKRILTCYKGQLLLLKNKHLWEKVRRQSRCLSSPFLWDGPWINRKRKLLRSSSIWVFVPHIIYLGLCLTKDEIRFIIVMIQLRLQTFKIYWNPRTTYFLPWWFEHPWRPHQYPMTFLLLDTSCYLSFHGLHTDACQAKPHLLLLVPRFSLSCVHATTSPEIWKEGPSLTRVSFFQRHKAELSISTPRFF